ncbi:MAG: hypothetical protein IT221_15420, partial [Fluviicola sp.]|nr:hypothetical protein [Fluviicola sp.]
MKPNLKNIVIIPFLLLSFFVVSQAGNTDFSFSSNIVDRFGNSDGISNNQGALMLLLPDGKIILAGSFSKYNGKNCSKIIRLNSDGSIDNSFNAGVTVSNSQRIQSLRLQSDGKILVGGDFTTYGGQSLSAIVRLHSDGSIDNSFQFSVPESNCHVKSIRLDASNNIYIGTFSGPLGFGTGKVYKLTSSGALDPNFEITYLPFTVSSSNWVNVIELQSDGKILVGGTYGLLKRLNTNGSLDLTFNTASLSYEVLSIVPLSNGKVVVGGLTLLRRLNADGTFDNTYAQSGTQFYGGDVRNMTLLSNGQILASGTSSLGNGLWKINSDGTIDTSIQLEESGIAYTTILSQFIQPDGKILLSGGFSTNKFRVSFGIERFNSNGKIDTTFNINNGLNQSGVVNDLDIFQNGDILIAGEFSSYNQIPQKSVSKLKANGQLDNSFNISVA